MEPRQGAGVFVMEPPDACFGSISLDVGNKISHALNVIEVRWARIESAVWQRFGAMVPGGPDPRRPSSNSIACSSAARQRKARLCLPPAIAAATTSLLREVLDALGLRAIPCDSASPGGRKACLSRAYQESLQREHLAIPEAISESDPEAARAAMRAHLTASQETLPSPVERTAGPWDAAKRGV